ncbi:MAG: bifunctional 4-hydroxy-2-oxoglutarate aldolase/2-dehydro-3-deoxy-phosphogluconate aldolase [Candidatus Omnitrophica bacterium]|nr:bifunctional 4-hydroxy-2-oxoglutarate aldolase/2-dehydro-3-deoxy-phosphogluconate aldolase [Candidatus Omnitrophota bacterium]
MDIARFKKLPVMGIVRGIEADVVAPIVESMIFAGGGTLEITMNTANAPALIRSAVKAARSRLMIGAGTVLNVETLKSALDAGATFIVTPVMIDEVVEYCVDKAIPVFPGAFTPAEIYRAHCAGATMVKVFPSGILGPKYFSEIKGPFADIELMACGGVTAENLPDYFSAGADAVAFGAGVFRREWLSGGKFDRIMDEIRRIVDSFKRTGTR